MANYYCDPERAGRLCNLDPREVFGLAMGEAAQSSPLLTCVVSDYGRRLSLDRMWIKYEYPECTFEDMCKVFGLPELRKKAHFCAISSTSGTATEVTAFSIITDYEKGIKFPIADFEITPDVAIVDPELTYSMLWMTWQRSWVRRFGCGTRAAA